jgi:hypothetical protein
MNTQELILNFLKNNAYSSSKEIFEGLKAIVGHSTVKRCISILLSKDYIIRRGNAKNSRYALSLRYNLFYPVNPDEYYRKEIDERNVLTGYNFMLIPDILSKVPLFTTEELTLLNSLQDKFSENISQLSDFEYRKDMEQKYQKTPRGHYRHKLSSTR